MLLVWNLYLSHNRFQITAPPLQLRFPARMSRKVLASP